MSDRRPTPDSTEAKANAEAEAEDEGTAALMRLHARFMQDLLEWRDAHPQGHIYALLDLAQPVDETHELHLTQLAERPVKRHLEAVLRPDLVHDPEALPQLLQIYAAGEHGYLDPDLLALTFIDALERCRSLDGVYVAGWLLSEAAPSELATHLTRAPVLFDPTQGKERYLPLFEPHRLALFSASADAAQRQCWLGPVDRWLFIDGGGALRCLDAARQPGTELPCQTLRMTMRQAAAQGRVPVARAVLLAIEREELLIDAPEPLIDASLIRGRGKGLHDTTDLVFFALNDLTIGPHWSEHPEAAAAIERVTADPDLGLGAELSALSDESLEAIASAPR